MTEKVIKIYFQNARDVSLNWEQNNPILMEGELAVVYDVNGNGQDCRLKVGDGETLFNDLSYLEDNTRIEKAMRGVANGIASLDSQGKVPIEQLPDGYLEAGSVQPAGEIPYQLGVVQYTGSSQSPYFKNYNSETMIMAGVTSAIDAGTYHVMIVPRLGYVWENGTRDIVVAEWVMDRAEIAVPTTTSTFTYDGDTKTPVWTGLTDNIICDKTSVMSAVNAGTYYGKFLPDDNHKWPDGSIDVKSVAWSIGKADGVISLACGNTTTDKNKTTLIVATTHDGATVSASSGDTGKATVSVTDNKVTVTGGATAGAVTITVTASAASNYNAASATLSITNYLGSLTIPSVSNTTQRTYTGSALTVPWSGYNSSTMTQGGTYSSTNAGTYTATVTPASGYRWVDGTTSAKSFSWKINKATPTLSLTTEQIELTPTKMSDTFTVNTNSDGTINYYTQGGWPVTYTRTNSGKVNTVRATKRGVSGIWVEVAASTNYTGSSGGKPMVVYSNIPSSTLNECEWSEIKAAVNAGIHRNLWKLGDLSRLTDFKGSIGGYDYWDIRLSFRIVEITTWGAIVFQQGKLHTGHEIALAHNYDQYIGANQPGLVMNRKGQVGNTTDTSLTDAEKQYGTNKGGAVSSYGCRDLLGIYESMLCNELRLVIRSGTRLADNVGQGNTSASGMTNYTCKIFNASQREIFGDTNFINPNIANGTVHLGWYAAGNYPAIYGTDNQSQTRDYWLQDPAIDMGGLMCFRVVNGGGGITSWSRYAALSTGVKPCFCV